MLTKDNIQHMMLMNITMLGSDFPYKIIYLMFLWKLEY